MAQLRGIDASRHQGVVDWRKVAGAGHAFAIIKATDGTSYRYIDWFRSNFPKVRAAGLVPGAYHFLSRADGAAQARYYVDEVNRLGGFAGVLAVVDVETNADGSHPSIETVRAFAAEFRRLVPGHPLIVYTGRWFWDGVLGNPHGADLGVLWHSEYETTQAEVADGPELDSYGGWTSATFWQWTSGGTCPGVSGRCDLNIFYGDRAALAALTQPQEADMAVTEAEFDRFETIAENAARSQLRMALKFLTTGGTSSITSGETWASGAVTLPQLVPDVGAFADAVAAKLGGSADTAAIQAAMREVLAGVKQVGHFELATDGDG